MRYAKLSLVFIMVLVVSSLSACKSKEQKEKEAYEQAAAETQKLMDEVMADILGGSGNENNSPSSINAAVGGVSDKESFDDADIYYGINDKNKSVKIKNGAIEINGKKELIVWDGNSGKCYSGESEDYEIKRDGYYLILTDNYNNIYEYVSREKPITNKYDGTYVSVDEREYWDRFPELIILNDEVQKGISKDIFRIEGDKLIVRTGSGQNVATFLFSKDSIVRSGNKNEEYVKEGGKSLLYYELHDDNTNLGLTIEKIDNIAIVEGFLSGYTVISGNGDLELKNKVTLSNVRSAYCKDGIYFFIKDNDELWGYGTNKDGVLGDGTGVDKKEPVKIMDDVAVVYIDFDYIYAIKNDKTLWRWGKGIYEPRKFMDDVVAVCANNLFLTSKGQIWAIGDGSFKGIKLSGSSPTQILSNVKYATIDGQNEITYVVYGNGRVEAFTHYFTGLGNEQTNRGYWLNNLPGNVRKVIPYRTGSKNVNNVMVILENGELWGMGENSIGELGDGTVIKRNKFVKIMDKTIAYRKFENKYAFGLLQSDGSFWFWNKDDPTPKPALENVVWFSDLGYCVTQTGDMVTINENGKYKLLMSGVKIPNVQFLQMSNEAPLSASVNDDEGSGDEDRKIYFYDTYNQIKDDPSIMWGDLNWEGWTDVKQPLNKESDGWYSFTMPTENITDSYNMLIFYNGLPDDDANSIQWVWRIDNGVPKGRYFIADDTNPINPPESFFKGTQRDAVSFATKEEAKNALEKE